MTQIVNLADKPLGRSENPATLKQMRYSFAYEVQTSTAGVKEALHTPEEKESAIWLTPTELKNPWGISGESAILIIGRLEVEPLSTEDIFKQEQGFIYYSSPDYVVLDIGQPWAGAGFIVDYECSSLKLFSGSLSTLPSALAKRLEEFQQLPAGWDSYEAEPISRSAVNQSIILLQHLYEYFDDLGETLPTPFVAPIPDGRIQIEWVGGEKEIEVTIDEKGTIEYLLFRSCDVLDYRTGSVSTARELGELLRAEIFRKGNSS